MGPEGNVIWYGASNSSYRYQVYNIDSEYLPIEGVYIVSRWNGKKWGCIELGHGNVREKLVKYRSCVQRWIDGATHVHVAVEGDAVAG